MNPLAIGAGILGMFGQRKAKRDAERQAQAVADAQNAVLGDFLTRNDARAAESRGAFDARMGAVQPDQLFAGMAGSEVDRAGAMRGAVAATPRMTMPRKQSTAAIMAPEVDAIRAREMGRVDDRIGAQARLDSFGDLVFDLGMGNMQTGRKIATVADLAGADAQMLPIFQELAGGSAAIKNKPSGIGDLISGAATAAGYYAGSRAGGR